MKKLTKSLALIFALLMCLSMLATALVGCGGENNDTDTGSDTGSDTSTDSSTDSSKPSTDSTKDYTVKVQTAYGMAVSGVNLTVMLDGNIKDYGTTGKNGEITFTLPKDKNYTITVKTAPAGYTFDSSYPINHTDDTVITTVSSVVENSDNELPGSAYKVGDIMYDFEVTTIKGEKLKLSEILKTKKMVLLNFFYTECGPCGTEFPLMVEAYEKYKNDIEIISINPHPGSKETLENVKMYASTMGLNFPVVKEGYQWASAFNVINYPTNLIIDRCGMIAFRDEGAITTQTIFNLLFDYFTKTEYKQQIITDMNQIAPQEKPDESIKMPSSEEISDAINNGEIDITYFPEKDEMCWPFIIKEDEEGNKYLFNSNSGKMNSYSQINMKVQLKRGEVLAFDYFSLTEYTEDYADVLYVFADGKDIFQIVGVADEWKTCYAFVAEEDGEYEINLCYVKNESMDNDPENDGVAISDMRIVGIEDIDTETYISRYAATQKNEDGFGFNKYANLVLDNNGFYRVCQNHVEGHECPKDGPFLLADLLGVTQFHAEKSITILMYENVLNEVDSARLLKYCNYAAGSKYYGLCAVTEELKELLIKMTDAVGVDDNPNEWLQICEYYSAYGTTKQMDNPILGLGTVSAYIATEGADKPNYVEYDGRTIMPRGLLYKFVPTKSGAYRVTSQSEKEVLGWIFLDGKETLYTDSDKGERLGYIYTGTDHKNCTMVAYFEEGKEYYIDIAYYSVNDAGSFTFTVEYLGESFEYFIVASPGPFTFEESENFNPDTMEGVGSTIAGGVDVMLGNDGYYYVKNKDGSQGSKLYADFLLPTNIFTKQNLQQVIEAGSFDFSKNESDQQMLAYISSFELQYILDSIEKTMTEDEFEALCKDNNLVDIVNGKKECEDEALLAEIEKYRGQYNNQIALEYFKEMWGENYEENLEINQLMDVMNGIYHGKRLPSENDQFILDKIAEFKEQYGDKSWREGFKTLWGDEYQTKYAEYKVDEVALGKYHGESYDLTDEMNSYVEKMIEIEFNEDGIAINPELQGCVEVDERLGELLQILMDKFTFPGVDHSWTKLCYYYEHIGA